MNRPVPTIQSALATGLAVLNDPEVRIPAAHAEGIVSLRTLLQGLASGQLIVSEPQVQPVALAPEVAGAKPRTPRRTKAEMALARANLAAKANGATAPAPAAPTSVQ